MSKLRIRSVRENPRRKKSKKRPRGSVLVVRGWIIEGFEQRKKSRGAFKYWNGRKFVGAHARRKSYATEKAALAVAKRIKQPRSMLFLRVVRS